MRSAIFAAAFAASVIAVPLEKRDVVTNTDVEVVYVTEYYTVTGGAQPTPAAEPEASPSPAQQYGGNHWGHHGWGGNKGHKTKTKTWTAPAATTTAPQASWEPAPTTSTEEAPPAYSTPASSPAPAPASGYSGVVVQHHNYHRSNHSASDIAWDAGLASTAGKIAALCVYEHNTEMDGGGYGQNIAAGVDADGIDRVITDMFYNGEINYYPFPPTNNDMAATPKTVDMSNFEKWGHMSQIVWAKTTKVGCATQYCPGGLANTGSNVPPYFTVCNYDPPGNYAGNYDNVHFPLGHAPVVAA